MVSYCFRKWSASSEKGSYYATQEAAWEGSTQKVTSQEHLIGETDWYQKEMHQFDQGKSEISDSSIEIVYQMLDYMAKYPQLFKANPVNSNHKRELMD